MGGGRTALAAACCPALLLLLQDAVGSRVTVVGRDGCTMRVCLPFAPSSQLATAALDALRAMLPADTWWTLYGQWLETSGEQRDWALASYGGHHW